MHISLYRKYRPQKFSEVIGQSAAVDLLRSSFLRGRMGHAYLFSGPRGCGKTTAARLLAKTVNCEKPDGGEPCDLCDSCRAVVSGEHLDVMEIDGASNRGIDQIRELKSHVALAPFAGARKVYILDEVHMLTAEAFNALLKTLEEPPASAMFIFATTEPHKVPVTIRSRCQHVPFHRISTEDIVAHLKTIAEAEGFAAEESALWEIARSADGALRDALSLAEQAAALKGGELSAASVASLSGGGSRAELERWVSLLQSDPAGASALLKDLLGRGVSPERFLGSLFVLLRDMWVYSLWGEKSFAGVFLSESEKAFLAGEVRNWDASALKQAVESCAGLFQRARWGLSSDVFSGLLLLELMRATGGGKSPERALPAPNEAPAVRAPAQKISAPEPEAKQKPETGHKPEAGHEPETGAVQPEGLPELFKGLWEDDLSLCAALVDVKISLKDGNLVFDCSSAAPGAAALLESLRVRHAISSFFGVSPKDGEAPAADKAVQKPERAVKSKETETVGEMSVERLSAYLGADLLMSRSVASDEPDTPDPLPPDQIEV